MSNSQDSSATAKWLPNRSHQQRTEQGMDHASSHPVLSHLAFPLNSLPVHCTTASTTFQQWYHTDVRLGGSSDSVTAPKYHQFPLHPPTPSPDFKIFQQKRFDNHITCYTASPSQSQLLPFSPHIWFSFPMIDHFSKSLKMCTVKLSRIFTGFLKDSGHQTSLKANYYQTCLPAWDAGNFLLVCL